MISELTFEYTYYAPTDSDNDPLCTVVIRHGPDGTSFTLLRSLLRQLANDILTDIASVEGV